MKPVLALLLAAVLSVATGARAQDGSPVERWGSKEIALAGLLCLHDATGEKKWLDEAKALTETVTRWHGDKDGSFFYTSNDHEKLFARAKDQYDGAQPSGNSVAARNLVRLWVKTKDERYRERAEKVLRSFGIALKSNATGVTTMVEALSLYLDAKK